MTETHDPGKEWRQERGIPIVASFDAYRALAVIGVVLFHVFEVCGVVAVAGDSLGGILIWGILPRSIIVFFVVSGFVMYLPTAVRGGDFGRVSSFAIGRVARIIPAYWLALVVALILLVVLAELPPAWSVLAHFTMFQTPALLIDGPVVVNGAQVGSFALGFGVVPPVWTMSVETAFYLVLPLVAVAFFRRPFLGLACAAGFLTLWQVAALHAGDVASVFGVNLSSATEARFTDFYASQFPSWAFALACGMTIAWLYVWLRDRVPAKLLEQRALWAAAASVPAVAVVFYLTGLDAVRDPNALNGLFARQPLPLSFAYPLATAWAMLAFSLAPSRVQRPLANEPMRRLADISYSVYLIHFAVIYFALTEFAFPTTGSLWSAVAWSALVFPVSIVYAWLSANLLERPIRRWANKYRRRGTASPAKTLPGEAVPPRAAGEGAGGSVSAGGEAPPVSIVLSTYNRAGWLRGAIDSVLAQDYPNLELLVVDDGSGDETPRLLEGYTGRYPEDRFRFVRQENAGQARALNHGNELARGEILGYLSDDDELAPGAVSRLAGELIDDPSAAVAYPAYLTIDEAGVEIDTVLPIEYSPLEALRLHDTVIGPGALTRRWALESAGGWDPELRYMGDLILWMGVGLAGAAIRVAEPLASWRRHPGSATVQRNVGRAREHLEIVRRGQAPNGFPPLSSADHAEALRNACLFASLMCGGEEEWPERFAMFDLQPKRISAFGSGYGAGAAIDWADVEENARLYRELVLLTARGAEDRAGNGEPAPAAGGTEAAVARLRELGALPREDGTFVEAVGEAELRLGLLESAHALGEDVDPQTMRFFLLDHDRVTLSDAEQSRVVRLGYCCTVQDLRAAISELTSGASAAAPEGSS